MFCDKKFKGLDYLQKHIRNKHADELHDYKDQERLKVRPTPHSPAPCRTHAHASRPRGRRVATGSEARRLQSAT